MTSFCTLLGRWSTYSTVCTTKLAYCNTLQFYSSRSNAFNIYQSKHLIENIPQSSFSIQIQFVRQPDSDLETVTPCRMAHLSGLPSLAPLAGARLMARRLQRQLLLCLQQLPSHWVVQQLGLRLLWLQDRTRLALDSAPCCTQGARQQSLLRRHLLHHHHCRILTAKTSITLLLLPSMSMTFTATTGGWSLSFA